MTHETPIRVLGISGSLRARSLNSAVIRSAAQVIAAGVVVEHYGGIGELPFFNSDDELAGPPAAVVEFRRRIAAADAVLISTPEYAHGMSGVLKNALEWIVGGGELVGKPTAVASASPGDGCPRPADDPADPVASAKIVDRHIVDEATLMQLRALLAELVSAVRRTPDGAPISIR